ncbi:uncharacterized protein si:dkeyp-34c12.1 [Megalops cyprinoides]|uniref:uncharacterized protein si:dkeyp-34c12.1 n=1 Tax=Megalops cyprinoides TaxID=118141 RepID=UPI0018641588|nr:uncharacterized protein si:dkeyp-34c12.1 [Megalops cyprinoides]
MNSTKRSRGSSKKTANKTKVKSNVSTVSRLENSTTCAELSSPGRKALNTIPTGNQLPRTPVKRNSLTTAYALETQRHDKHPVSSSGNDADENPSAVRGNIAKDRLSTPEVPGQQQRDEGVQRKLARRNSTISAAAQLENADPDHFIRGMQGYQWTAADLEFVERTKMEREIQQLKSELKTLQRQRKDEQQKRDLSLANREKVQADLTEMDAFDLTMRLARDFLCQKLGMADVTLLDPKSLMAQIRVADVQHAMQKETAKVATLKNLVKRAQHLSKQEEEQSQENKRQKQKIRQKQAKVDRLKNELSDLKAKLSEAEDTLQATQRQLEAITDPKPTEDEGEIDMAKVLRRSKRIAKRKENFLEREAILKKIRSMK